jgi:hypothetical protein
MSKRVQFPNGYIGTVSDKVAAILAKREGHKVFTEQGKPAPAEKTAAEKAAAEKAAAEKAKS